MKLIKNAINRLVGPVSKGVQNGITIGVVAVALVAVLWVGYKVKQTYDRVYYSVAFNHPEVIDLVVEHTLKTDTLEHIRIELGKLQFEHEKTKELYRSDSIMGRQQIQQLQSQLLQSTRTIRKYEAAMPCQRKTITKRLVGRDVVVMEVVPCDSL